MEHNFLELLYFVLSVILAIEHISKLQKGNLFTYLIYSSYIHNRKTDYFYQAAEAVSQINIVSSFIIVSSIVLSAGFMALYCLQLYNFSGYTAIIIDSGLHIPLFLAFLGYIIKFSFSKISKTRLEKDFFKKDAKEIVVLISMILNFCVFFFNLKLGIFIAALIIGKYLWIDFVFDIDAAKSQLAPYVGAVKQKIRKKIPIIDAKHLCITYAETIIFEFMLFELLDSTIIKESTITHALPAVVCLFYLSMGILANLRIKITKACSQKFYAAFSKTMGENWYKMERCDFASITIIIRKNLLDGSYENQVSFLEALFNSYLNTTDDYYFDIGLASKWLNGLFKLSPSITLFYSTPEHRKELAITIEDTILPCLSDGAMVVQNIFALLIGDLTVSANKKDEFLRRYPCKSAADEAAFISDVLVFGMSRPFVARDIRKPSLPPAGSLSPLLGDFVTDEGVPKPCHHFCGREKELAALHTALIENSKVFLHGIPGVGKSEIAKAYAKEHRKEYTNILYFTYTGDLKHDIADLIFADDLLGEDEDERFRKHNRFLRTLREDTLLIIDNFNTTSTRDAVLDVVLKYRCRVLFTTRSALPGQCCVLVEEIDDAETLFRLAAQLYADAESNRAIVEQIIETVHRHTLAVELAARLLETGILKPQAVLDKLREERASFDASDKINISKDGKSKRATYYDHIHTLFALFGLPAPQRAIMTNLTLIPLTGIPARLFGEWMDFYDLNEVNELVELGFIQSKPGNRITLHPMMQEVTLSDLPPSITNCHTMLESIRVTCQLHGESVPYHQLMFQTVENAIDLAAKDDRGFYLLLLQDVFQYMDNYKYEDGMKRLIDEMDALLSDKAVGAPKDRALLLGCRAMMEKSPKKAIKLMEDALALLPEITPDNALLVSNLNANVGALYRTEKKINLAQARMKTAMDILEEYGLVGYHDSIVQYMNYAALLTDIGDAAAALEGLRRIEHIVRTEGGVSGDYAELLETMGCVCLMQMDVPQGTAYLKRALAIYEEIWAGDSQLIESKKAEIQSYYAATGAVLAKALLAKRGR